MIEPLRKLMDDVETWAREYHAAKANEHEQCRMVLKNTGALVVAVEMDDGRLVKLAGPAPWLRDGLIELMQGHLDE